MRARRAGRPLPGFPVLAVLALATGCDGPPPDGGRGSDVPRVVASIFPVADLLGSIGGEAVTVDVLLPPGTSPDLFDATPRQMRSLQDASLYVEVGGGLDPWARSLAREGLRTLTLTDGLSLHRAGAGEESGNPHVWLDPILVRDRLLPPMTRALLELAPDSAEAIRERSAALGDTLTALDGQIRALLDTLRSRSFVATHPAWTYFAERYGLREVGVVHAHPGQEPSSRALAALVDSARAAGVRVVFAEPQLGRNAARTLAEELRVPLRVLDPLGGPGVAGRDGYAALLRYNARMLAGSLGGGPDGAEEDGGDRGGARR